jgi:hypothetical protein
VRTWAGFIWLRIQFSGGFVQTLYEYCSTIKGEELPDQLSNYQLPKKGSVPFGYFVKITKLHYKGSSLSFCTPKTYFWLQHSKNGFTVLQK